MKVHIVRIQRFSTHDGPGIRTVVFFKGCPLRCAWCHNPETRSARDQIFFRPNDCIGCGSCLSVCPTSAHTVNGQGIHTFDASHCIGCQACTSVCPTGACEPVGKTVTVEEILSAVERDRAFYGTEGGLTVSGGEPMAQPEACIALLKEAKERGISTAAETCGYFDARYVEAFVKHTDLLLWDFKDGVNERHLRYTGKENGRIRENLLAADALGCPSVLRCIMVKGVNMDEAHYVSVAELFRSLRFCKGVELLPYHTFGGSKAEQLGLRDPARTDWIPQADDLDNARRTLLRLGCSVLEM